MNPSRPQTPALLAVLLVTAACAPAAVTPVKSADDARLAAAIEESGAKALLAAAKNPASLMPIRGKLCVRVTPDSFADKNGITPECIFAPVGRFQTLAQPPAAPEHSRGNDFVVWTAPDGKRHRMEIPPGLMGFQSIPYRSMNSWYLQHGRRGAAWDAQVIAALRFQARDAAIAESLWAVALDHGYRPDPLFHWCMAFIRAEQQDFAACKECVAAYGTLKPPVAETDFPLENRDFISLGLMTGDMNLVQRAAEAFRCQEADLELRPQQAALLAKWAARIPPPPLAPSRIADGTPRRSFLRSAALGKNGFRPPQPLVEVHRKACGVDDAPPHRFAPEVCAAPVNSFLNVYLIPPKHATEMDISMEFALAPHADTTWHSRFLQGFELALNSFEDADEKSYRRQLLAALGTEAFYDGNSVHWSTATSASWITSSPSVRTAAHKGVAKYQTEPMPLFRCGSDYHTVRLVKVGGWMEALVDGKRLALVPASPDYDNLFPSLQVIGCRLTVRSLRAELLERVL